MSFEARYRSRCADCGDVIAKGDLVVYNEDDELAHADCEESGATTPEREPCRRCWMVAAVNGACGCDDSEVDHG